MSSSQCRRLLPFAMQRIRVMTEELERSHMDPISNRIEPAEIRIEVEENRRWLKQAAAEIA